MKILKEKIWIDVNWLPWQGHSCCHSFSECLLIYLRLFRKVLCKSNVPCGWEVSHVCTSSPPACTGVCIPQIPNPAMTCSSWTLAELSCGLLPNINSHSWQPALTVMLLWANKDASYLGCMTELGRHFKTGFTHWSGILVSVHSLKTCILD